MEEVTNYYATDPRSWADLYNQVNALQAKLDAVTNDYNNLEKQRTRLNWQIAEAAQVVEELISSGVITNEEDIKVLCSSLNLDVTREVSVTLRIEVEGTIELSYGEEVHDSDFTIGDISYNGIDLNFYDPEITVISVDE